MKKFSCLQIDDSIAVDQLLNLYPINCENFSIDILSCDCIYITSYSVKIARKVADNIHKYLLKISNVDLIIRGHESEFNISTLTITENRIINMVFYCAFKVITQILPDEIKNQNPILEYRQKVIATDNNLRRVITEFVRFNLLPDHDLKLPVKNQKVNLFC